MVDRISAAGFIGRERELAELEASLGDARDGQPRLVFVAGESGVGKSRLLGGFGGRARGPGAAPPRARADDPGFDGLPDFARGELARLAPELGVQAPERTEDREGES